MKSFTDACAFIFLQHPYDVGDWVIWGKEKDLRLIVMEIHLQHTTFECVESGRTVHIPHAEICGGYIENLSRTSKHFVASFTLHVDHSIDQMAIESFQKDTLNHLLLSDPGEKLPILRYHHMPEISLVPIKPEDSEVNGIRVDFRRKQWVGHSMIF